MAQAAVAVVGPDRSDPRRSPPSPSYLDIFRAGPVERIGMIKSGVRAQMVKRLLVDLDIPQAMGLAALALPAATVNRKVVQDQKLTAGESERVIGMASLIGQVEAMMQESGGPEGFNATAWMSRWLREPVPALGGVAPMTFMDTLQGQALVARTLAQMQSGVYA